MQPKITTSLITTVPLKVTVVAVKAVCFKVSAVVVVSHALHAQPFGAVAALPMVITIVQAVAPAVNFPAVAPPARADSVQPAFEVNVVPTDI